MRRIVKVCLLVAVPRHDGDELVITRRLAIAGGELLVEDVGHAPGSLSEDLPGLDPDAVCRASRPRDANRARRRDRPGRALEVRPLPPIDDPGEQRGKDRRERGV